MLNFINSKHNVSILKKIHPLYESSFPDDEKVPFFVLKQQAKKDISDIIGIYDESEFVGFVIFIDKTETNTYNIGIIYDLQSVLFVGT